MCIISSTSQKTIYKVFRTVAGAVQSFTAKMSIVAIIYIASLNSMR